MRLQQIAALAWRESRTARRRLLLYMSSISLGVAALVAIDSFADNVTRSVREQSRALLGGDVSVTSRATWSPKVGAFLDSLQRSRIPVARVTTFASMALVPRTGGTRLAQVRAVTPSYPFYGEITTEPAGRWRALHQGGRVALVDPALLVSLDARLGDSLAVGEARFLIIGALKVVPGDPGVSAAIGPRIYIPERHLAETKLLAFGSRAEYEALVKLPSGGLSPARFVGRFERRFEPERVRMRTVAENEAGLTRAIDELSEFLGIVGLVALLLGGIGVASGVHAFVMKKIDTVAILRCLGATSRQVLAIYLLQAVAMGLLGAVAGAALGVALQFALPKVVEDLLPVTVDVALAPQALLLGLGVGAWVALVFALRPLIALRRISPLQTLRRESDAQAIGLGRLDLLQAVVSLAIVGSIVFIAVTRAGDLRQGLGMTAAIAGAVATLWIAAALLTALARRLVRAGLPFTARQGVASLYRPGNQTRAVILALGFGVFLVSTLYQVRSNLLRRLDVQLATSRANVLFFDVQDDQAPGVDSIIAAGGYQTMQSAPIVPMRIAAINGIAVADLMKATGVRRRAPWTLRREYRSTFRDTLVTSEQLTAGRWFRGNRTANDTLPEASFERDLARDLKLRIGDVVTWDVQGVRVPVRVASFREVNWARFEPNFFVVFETRALERAPKQFVKLVSVPNAADVPRLQRDVVRRFPTVSSLDLTLIQQTVGDVLGKVTVAIRFLAFVSLLLGIPVLFSAVAATRRDRLREGVLLKTLGATRGQVARILVAEYALLGLLGSLTGVLLSVAGGWALMKFVFEAPFHPAILPAALVGGAMMAVAVAIGLLTGRDVFRETPMVALREG